MKITPRWMMILAGCCLAAQVWADPATAADSLAAHNTLAFTQAEIPRAEMRSLAILNIDEYRCNFSLPNPPVEFNFVIETYTDGKFSGRYVLYGASCWNQKQYASGLITVAWRQDERELVTQVDNGWGDGSAWTFRVNIPAERFDRPIDPYFFEKSTLERRDGYDLYPLLGLAGVGHNMSIFPRLGIKTAQDFLREATSAGRNQAMVIYLLYGSGGIPVGLKYDNKNPTG